MNLSQNLNFKVFSLWSSRLIINLIKMSKTNDFKCNSSPIILVWVTAWLVVIFGITTTSDISKFLFVHVIITCTNKNYCKWNLRQFWNVTSGIFAKDHVQIMLLFVYTTTRKSFVIFTCRYFNLSEIPLL